MNEQIKTIKNALSHRKHRYFRAVSNELSPVFLRYCNKLYVTAPRRYIRHEHGAEGELRIGAVVNLAGVAYEVEARRK